MVDEPELNLHPENQRKIARLFARLVNVGLKVFLTTHSDYIIREFNTLIMLKGKKKITQEENYEKKEWLSPQQFRVYITTDKKSKTANKQKTIRTLIKANITPEEGIEMTSFDESIADLNRIQDRILLEDS